MTPEDSATTTAGSMQPVPPAGGALFLIPCGLGLGLMFLSVPCADFFAGLGFLIAIVSLALYASFARKALKPFRSKTFEVLLGLSLVGAALSLTVAIDFRLALTAFAELSIGTLSFYLVFVYLQARKEYQRLFFLFLLVPAAFVILIGLLQIITGDYSASMSFLMDNGSRFVKGRATSIFSSPNIFAAYLIAVIPLAVTAARFRTLKGYEKTALFLLGSGGIICLVFTFSRNGWLSAAISALIMALWLTSKRVRLAVLLSCTAIVLGGLMLLAYRQEAVRNYVFHSEADARRLLIYSRSAAMIRDNWLFGTGAGNFRHVYPRYLSQTELQQYKEPLPWHAHSLALNMAIETGIPGTLAFIAFIAVVLRELFRARVKGFEKRLMYIGSSWGIVSMLAINIIDCVMNDHKCGFFFFLLLGLSCALVRTSAGDALEDAGSHD
jgi:putative inorganic carbon (hco3(-)) transporter